MPVPTSTSRSVSMLSTCRQSSVTSIVLLTRCASSRDFARPIACMFVTTGYLLSALGAETDALGDEDERDVRTRAETDEALIAVRLRQDPVFPARTASRSAVATPANGFDAAAARAGIAGVTFHSMRHAFASRMISRGINSTVLAALMGHESSTITERRYIHLFDQHRTDEQVRQAMERSL